MDLDRVKEPVASAAVALLVLATCAGAFLPPFNERFIDQPLIVVLLGLGVAASLIVHLVFVGITARRLQRSATGWVLAALLGFPIVSLVGLAIFEWRRQERQRAGVAQG